jgi:3-oxoacyl-[acyl-carrier protein] reductase
MNTRTPQSRTALVTGGSRGIGRAIVERLARDGIVVVFSFAHDQTAADNVVATTQTAGSRAWAVRADLSERDAAFRLFRTAETQLCGLDILVNNAGSGIRPVPISQTTDADYDQMMAVNTHAVFTLMREATTRLRDGGSIVNISTINTVAPTAAVAVHAPSKAAVEQFSACAARELGPRSITVNTISPGATDTDLLRNNNPGIDLEQALVPITPLGRLGQPTDIANVVAFLVGSDGRWITGQNIRAGGGLP